MKIVITLFAVTLLIAAFLYPLFIGGIGRPVAWIWVVLMAAGGFLSFYLLYKFRRSL